MNKERTNSDLENDGGRTIGGDAYNRRFGG